MQRFSAVQKSESFSSSEPLSDALTALRELVVWEWSTARSDSLAAGYDAIATAEYDQKRKTFSKQGFLLCDVVGDLVKKWFPRVLKLAQANMSEIKQNSARWAGNTLSEIFGEQLAVSCNGPTHGRTCKQRIRKVEYSELARHCVEWLCDGPPRGGLRQGWIAPDWLIAFSTVMEGRLSRSGRISLTDSVCEEMHLAICGRLQFVVDQCVKDALLAMASEPVNIDCEQSARGAMPVAAWHSQNFGTLRWQEEELIATADQARVIQYFVESRQSGITQLRKTDIEKAVGAPHGRLWDRFRTPTGNRIRKLFIKEVDKGRYSLVEPPPRKNDLIHPDSLSQA